MMNSAWGIPDPNNDPIGYLQHLAKHKDAKIEGLEHRVEQLEKEMAALKAIVARQLTGEEVE